MAAPLARKPWRLSASIVILAPRASVPDCALTGLAAAEEDAADYRVCLLKRAARSSFMPETMVFPGGAVDAQDLTSSSRLLGSSAGQEGAIRCCAIREAFEESGIGIFEPPLQLPKEDMPTWRRRVHDSAAEFQGLCDTAGVVPGVNSLHYWCSFITPDQEHDRLKKGGFDARFYVWCVPPNAVSQLQDAQADAQETTELVWVTPKEALVAAAAGTISMVPPQWYILKELADRCPQMAAVPGYAGGAERSLQRDYPIKPYFVMLSAAEKAGVLERLGGAQAGTADTKPPNTAALVYPGDERHAVFPGPPGARHRMNMAGEFGGRTKYELERNVSHDSLPLKEVQSEWYSLAKL